TRGDSRQLLHLSASMAELGVNFVAAVDELCSVLHRCAVAQALPDAVDQSQSDANAVVELAQQLTAEDVQLFYELAQREREMVLGAADARAAFEMLLLRLHAFRPVAVLDTSIDASAIVSESVADHGDGERSRGKKSEPPSAAREKLDADLTTRSTSVAPGKLDRPSTVESTAVSTGLSIATVGKSEALSNGRFASEKIFKERSASGASEASEASDESGVHSANREAAIAAPRGEDSAKDRSVSDASVGDDESVGDDDSVADKEWHEVLNALALRGSIASIASHCIVQSREATQWNLCLDEQHAQLFSDRHSEQLEVALSKLLGESIKIHITVGEVIAETPAGRAHRLARERLATAKKEIESDPRVTQLLTEFEGTLVTDSVTVDHH
ncbi:MAG: DNA polymerase III subunit gamma/tau C-terminal domain-containing protein, partial [Pseudomonadota bacterium]